MSCWTRASVVGSPPQARCAHALALTGSGKVYVFGGWNGKSMLADLHMLQVETVTWTRPVTCGTAPSDRAGHTMVAVGSRLYVVGGGDGQVYLNDVQVLDTETLTWSQPEVTGDVPAPRSRHSCTLVRDRELWVIGGGDDVRVYHDVYVFDTATNAWSCKETTGDVPCSRWGHTATLVGEREIFVFAGHDGKMMLNDLHVLDTVTLEWRIINKTGGLKPDPRAGHTATLAKDGKTIYVFAGGDGSRLLRDVIALDVTTMHWRKPLITGTSPAARCAHTAFFYGDDIMVFGGGDGNRRFKDLYCVNAARLAVLALEPDVLPVSGASTPVISSKRQGTPRSRGSKGNNRQGDVVRRGPRSGDLQAWMQQIGLGKYYDLFAAEEIDAEALPYLTEEDLSRIGITALGPRRKLMAAVTEMRRVLDGTADGAGSSGVGSMGSDNACVTDKTAQQLIDAARVLSNAMNQVTIAMQRAGMQPPPSYPLYASPVPPINLAGVMYDQSMPPPPMPPVPTVNGAHNGLNGHHHHHHGVSNGTQQNQHHAKARRRDSGASGHSHHSSNASEYSGDVLPAVEDSKHAA